VKEQPSKVQLRQQLLKQRRSLPPAIWRANSDHLCRHLQSSPLFKEAQTILAYVSVHQEPDLSLLFNTNRHWGLPRCVGQSLRWHSWTPGDSLEVGAYGIQEPSPEAPLMDSSEVDLILVPAVACDHRKYRLGYGGGFYDRLLNSSEWRSKPTIGIVFNFAYLPQLPIDSWDRQLSAICSETGYLTG
jgi:5-formyltetrahydrofolate cyclo-ligase